MSKNTFINEMFYRDKKKQTNKTKLNNERKYFY